MGSVSAKGVERLPGCGCEVIHHSRQQEGIGDDGPRWQRNDVEGEAAFEVGLIEAGKGHARVHGDEERVEVFAAVVVVFKASDGFACGGDVGGEFCFDEVGAFEERGGGKDDVAVLDLAWDGVPLSAS